MRRFPGYAFLAATLCALMSGNVMGQTELLRDQMTDGSGWSTIPLVDNNDTFATFGFDYSRIPGTDPNDPGAGSNPLSGIPEAPNSQPGDAPTSGLLMVVNFGDGTANAIAAFPTGMNFSGSYTLQFDMWLNTNGPFPLGGSGSTEFGGGSVGFDNNTTTPFSGAGFHASGEGGSSFDYRLFADDEFQNYDTHTGQTPPISDPVENDLYDPKFVRMPDVDEFGEFTPCVLGGEECGGHNADGNTYMRTIFSPPPEGIDPGTTDPDDKLVGTVTPPPEQENNFDFDQFGEVKPGSFGFQWVVMKFTVTEAGDDSTVFVQATSTDTGLTADIGTFTFTNTYIDQQNMDPILTSFDGNVSLTYRDPFDSLPQPFARQMNFGVFDNVLVTAPDDGLVGDYNGDGKVGAEDYTVWQDTLGSTSDLRADGSGNGTVGPEDYAFWADNFGNMQMSGSAANATVVPEPATAFLMLLAACGLLASRRR